MNVGLPGTGIGGLFYMISVLVMFGYELVQTARGRTSRARWRLVATEMGMLAAIVVAIYGTGWLLSYVLAHPIQVVRVIVMPVAGLHPAWLGAVLSGILPFAITLSPMILVLLGVRAARWAFGRGLLGGRSCPVALPEPSHLRFAPIGARSDGEPPPPAAPA